MNGSIYAIFFKVLITEIAHPISAEFCWLGRHLLFNVCIVIVEVQIIFHAFCSCIDTTIIILTNSWFLLFDQYLIVLPTLSCIKIIAFKHSQRSEKIYVFLWGLFKLFISIKYRIAIFMGGIIYLILKLLASL